MDVMMMGKLQMFRFVTAKRRKPGWNNIQSFGKYKKVVRNDGVRVNE
jgi:hypothetical protein